MATRRMLLLVRASSFSSFSRLHFASSMQREGSQYNRSPNSASKNGWTPRLSFEWIALWRVICGKTLRPLPGGGGLTPPHVERGVWGRASAIPRIECLIQMLAWAPDSYPSESPWVSRHIEMFKENPRSIHGPPTINL